MEASAELSSFAAIVTDMRGVGSPRREITDRLKRGVIPGTGVKETLVWLEELDEIAALANLSLTELRGIVNWVAWDERAAGNQVMRTGDYLREMSPRPGREDQLTLLVEYYVSQRLRFDFRFERLLSESREWVHRDTDAHMAAIVVFAQLGQLSPDSLGGVERMKNNFELDAMCRDILLHGLWFGTHLDDQADQLLALSDEILSRGDAEANLYFRRAFAFRRKGQLDHAMREILTAMELLGSGQNDVHQDYAREREIISTTKLLNEQVGDRIESHLTSALSSLDARAKAAEENVSRSLIGVVEILGLFVALIGFLGAGAVTLFQGFAFERQLLIIVILLFGSIGFFLTLRFVAGVRSRSPKISRDRSGR